MDGPNELDWTQRIFNRYNEKSTELMPEINDDPVTQIINFILANNDLKKLTIERLHEKIFHELVYEHGLSEQMVPNRLELLHRITSMIKAIRKEDQELIKFNNNQYTVKCYESKLPLIYSPKEFGERLTDNSSPLIGGLKFFSSRPKTRTSPKRWNDPNCVFNLRQKFRR